MPKRAVPAEGRRVNVNTKVTQEVRQKIEAAAAASDRPISSEIEFRLEQSFANEVLIRSLTGADVQAEMFWRLANVVTQARAFCRRMEFDEIRTRQVIQAAIIRVATVYCWTEGDLPQQGYVGVIGKHVPLKDRTPEEIGIEFADEAMIYNDDRAAEDLDIRVDNRWSGDGREGILRAKLTKHGNPPGTTPLKDILRGK